MRVMMPSKDCSSSKMSSPFHLPQLNSRLMNAALACTGRRPTTPHQLSPPRRSAIKPRNRSNELTSLPLGHEPRARAVHLRLGVGDRLRRAFEHLVLQRDDPAERAAKARERVEVRVVDRLGEDADDEDGADRGERRGGDDDRVEERVLGEGEERAVALLSQGCALGAYYEGRSRGLTQNFVR
jgi:hypothetical protein